MSINYKEIIDELDEKKVFLLLQKLNADPIDKGTYILGKTVCHHINSEEASYKLYYYKNSHLFQCYSECGTLSIFKFLKNYYETRHIEYDWYEDIYQAIVDCSNFNPQITIQTETYKSLKNIYDIQRKEKKLPEYPKEVMDCFVKKYPQEWLNDHISKEAMDKFNIKYSISQNKIIIPHYDANGRLVGIRGRALNEWEIENVGKYLPIQIENTWYKHPLSMNVYGLYENKENIKKTRICYLFESEKAIMQCESFNMLNCAVAVCGSNFNKYQLNILMKECQPKEIIICFDKEELPGEEKYFNKLYSICQKYNNYCDFSFIYDRNNLLNLKDSPSDKGEEIFKELIRKRVRV